VTSIDLESRCPHSTGHDSYNSETRSTTSLTSATLYHDVLLAFCTYTVHNYYNNHNYYNILYQDVLLAFCTYTVHNSHNYYYNPQLRQQVTR